VEKWKAGKGKKWKANAKAKAKAKANTKAGKVESWERKKIKVKG
jgi:hypothetical protein